MKITIDSREKGPYIKKMQKLFDSQDVDSVVKELPYGDYLYKGICIERKRYDDYVGSVRSRHLYKQCLVMRKAIRDKKITRAFVIIIGHHKDARMKYPYIRKWTIAQHNGSKASLSRMKGIYFHEVDNDKQFADLVVRLFKKLTDGKKITKRSTMKSSSSKLIKTVDDAKFAMMKCLPGVAEAKAELLMERYNILIVDDLGDKPRIIKKSDGSAILDTIVKFNKGE